MWLLEAVVLSPKTPTPFSCSDFAVEHLEFSGDALQFAYSVGAQGAAPASPFYPSALGL